jgi:stearoyl-CoA desaturase (Delta-9 desaturase)
MKGPRLDLGDIAYTSPYLLINFACLFVFLVGWSPVALLTALVLYLARMFIITAFYHRYFSHRAFRASRPVQFLMGAAGTSCMQQGPLWWAAHHRIHHQVSDQPDDIHSPRQHGFFWSQVGWIISRSSTDPDPKVVADLSRFPEIRLLDRLHAVVPALLALGTFIFGAWLKVRAPHLGTSGPQMLIWGFGISTVVLHHATFTINSLSHRYGNQRFDTADDSRNNFWLALLTFGEGWHNNHHRFPSAVRQGHKWWEIDLTYYVLVVMSWLRIISDLKPIPRTAAEAARAEP